MSGAAFQRLGVALIVVISLLSAGVWALNQRDESPIGVDAQPSRGSADQVARGAYLVKAGNCVACHTGRGGLPFVGGRAMATPFGTVFASNITPDEPTGLGRWSADHFWRALHNGRSMDGHLLYPAFPYTNTTLVTRPDADAMYAFLRTVPPVRQPNRPHELAFPVNTQWALGVWRALFFKPEVHVDEPSQSVAWNRGAYLVRGLGHCSACHAARNALGATEGALELSGGLIPLQNWYAPSLADAHEASVAAWSVDEVVALLRSGRSAHGVVLGPMADVVWRSTQYLSEPDLRAMAVFLKALPQVRDMPRAEEHMVVAPERLARGAALYERHCAECHGLKGEGAGGLYPALAGNRTVLMTEPANLVRVMANGGFAPATALNPRPFGMPPMAPFMSNDEMALVATYVRNAWGNQADVVDARDVGRLRGGSDD
jgi:mono/diheme cytochrome c family protein